MDPNQREAFRLALLRVLDANRTRFGLQCPAITTHLALFGFRPTRDQVLDEIDYLERKGFVEEALKVISRENRAWRLSDAGRAFLDQQGF